ncbi:MAG: DUF4358 domain-containing protein [bacterium]|nr:DUF4358 domain-containing protein [bacterium]
MEKKRKSLPSESWGGKSEIEEEKIMVKIKKTWVGMLMAAAMLAAMTACGQGNNAIDTTAAESELTSTAVEEQSSAESTEEVEGETLEENVPEVADELLVDIYQKVKEAYGEDYIPNTFYDDETLAQLFNVDAEWCEAYIAEGSMISAHVDTFIGIKAKTDYADTVEKALSEYQEMLIDNSIQYPMNQLKVEASQIVRHGDYVFFVILGQIPDSIEDEEAGLEAARESTQIAVDIIDSFFE